MNYVDTTPGNPHNIVCPSCVAIICPRCAALEDRMSPDGFDGCAECHRTMKRLQRALRQHKARDHQP